MSGFLGRAASRGPLPPSRWVGGPSGRAGLLAAAAAVLLAASGCMMLRGGCMGGHGDGQEKEQGEEPGGHKH